MVLSTGAMRNKLEDGSEFEAAAPPPPETDPDLYRRLCEAAGPELEPVLQRLEDGEKVAAADLQRLRARLREQGVCYSL